MGLDAEDLKFLSHHLAPGTQAGYGYVFKRFCKFCETLGVDPFTCSPVIIVKYLRQLYESGAAYSTVNHHRSTISKFHHGIDGKPVGSHSLVSQAVRSVFRLRPPLPKYRSTYDISKVFDYLITLPENCNLNLKMLSLKTVFLLTASLISRVSSIARLGPRIHLHEVSGKLF